MWKTGVGGGGGRGGGGGGGNWQELLLCGLGGMSGLTLWMTKKKANISKAGGQAQADITQKDRQTDRQNLNQQQ